MDDPAPFSITLSRGSADAVNRTFIGWFFAFAILFAGAAFYRPAIQAFAVGFPVYLVLWKLRLRRATHAGDVLLVSPDRLALESGTRSCAVSRDEADEVRLKRSGRTTELLVLNSLETPVFKLKIDDSDRDSISAALARAGWPLQEPD
ncbi:MAG TPA: hypothetical protein VEU28_09500 [Actinomycetota bacterium]|nr:hypothetical protein [Actinomycetota bacterium]